jgi:hypothetical protein
MSDATTRIEADIGRLADLADGLRRHGRQLEAALVDADKEARERAKQDGGEEDPDAIGWEILLDREDVLEGPEQLDLCHNP